MKIFSFIIIVYRIVFYILFSSQNKAEIRSRSAWIEAGL